MAAPCSGVFRKSRTSGRRHLLDPGPRDPGRVVLQAAQLAGELRREKIAAGGQHLPELDEGDPAVLHGQPHRAGQPGPALRRGQLGPAPAPRIRQQPPPRQDPADLPVAPRPAHPPSHGPQHVDRPGHRSARHQRLRDDQENHAGQQRDDHPDPPTPGGIAVEVPFELAGVEWPAEHLVFHGLSFHSNRTGWFSHLGFSPAWSPGGLSFGTCCRDDHVCAGGGHRVLQRTGAGGVGAEAADAGARSSGVGAGTSAPPWSRRNGG